MDEQFLRNEMLWGAAGQERLAQAHVLLVGLGGVGSYAAECLVRAGVGELTIVDNDVVSPSNLNRQLEALHSTLGLPKTQAVANRLLDINPRLRLHPLQETYSAANRALFFPQNLAYDYVADAIDLVSCKLDLVEAARASGTPIISALGTGNKLDPARLQVTDLALTQGCPLARVMRRELRRRGVAHLKVVFSPEAPATPQAMETPPPGRRSVPASNPWVPAAAGLLLGSAVVRDILAKEESPC